MVDPTPGPAGRGGGFRVLYDAGYEIDHMREELFARIASPEEAALLQLSPGEWVVELHRTTYTADAQRLWNFQQMHHEPRPCSVGIGLGSHDLGVADATVDLYQRGMMPLIVFTCATSRTTRERMPRGEAEHYRERALELGVPTDAVLVEPNARNTGENIRFSRSLLAECGVDILSVLLVSKPYEERRAHATARKLRPQVEIVSAPGPMTLAEYVDSFGPAACPHAPTSEEEPVSKLTGSREISRLTCHQVRSSVCHRRSPCAVRQ
ncbi:ElyC/SanA/YdcF family protein [Streptomyces sp. NPDC051664]|uniref:YdcF family protein n=1 Tax=Streptomyces sp. NPDC051664 TaxID=3365668 RepID=UPI00379F71D1